MVVIENKEELSELIEKGVAKAFDNIKGNCAIISGWDAIEAFLGIGKHQIKVNYAAGQYDDALQIRGRTVLLNKNRLWEVMKERETK